MFKIFSSEDYEEYTEQRIEAVTSVSADDYKSEVKILFGDFKEEYLTKTSDDERSEFVVQTLDSLLALKLPGAFKDIHFELAFSLNLVKEGLEGDEKRLLEGLDRLDVLLNKELWIEE